MEHHTVPGCGGSALLRVSMGMGSSQGCCCPLLSASGDEAKKLPWKPRWLRSRWAHCPGCGRAPAEQLWARWGVGLKGIQQMAKVSSASSSEPQAQLGGLGRPSGTGHFLYPGPGPWLFGHLGRMGGHWPWPPLPAGPVVILKRVATCPCYQLRPLKRWWHKSPLPTAPTLSTAGGPSGLCAALSQQ